MDQQQVKDFASDAAATTSKIAGDAATQAAAGVKSAFDQGKTMVQDLQAGANSLARQASETGRQAVAQAGEVMQGLAQQGSLAGEQVRRFVAEQPFAALAIACAIGYGLGYLIHRR